MKLVIKIGALEVKTHGKDGSTLVQFELTDFADACTLTREQARQLIHELQSALALGVTNDVEAGLADSVHQALGVIQTSTAVTSRDAYWIQRARLMIERYRALLQPEQSS